jgi:serine O-acetyltransferase
MMSATEIIHADLFRYKDELVRLTWIRGLLIPGFRYTYFLRKSAQYSKHTLSGIFFRSLLQLHSYIYGYQINPSTKIGKGLYLGHRGIIIINSNAVLGECCNLSPGVTIGQTNRGAKKGSPVIGNKVWIGTNAVIVGRISIGDDVLIAPNAYVNIDIPSNSIVLGNPAQIISRDNPTLGYIDHCFES